MERPVSWSEINTWCQCRMQHYWRYVVGITPKTYQRAPSRGSAGHAALAAAYLGQDWREALQEWLKEQIESRELFNEEVADFEDMVDTASQILPRYFDHYAEEEQHWEVLETEYKFEISISGLKTKLKGFIDGIIRDKDGDLWLLEHKFPQRQFRSREQVDLNGQLGVYQYAANKCGFPTIGIIYNQLLWQLPRVPKINKNGSISRQAIKTDWPTYRAMVSEQGLDPTDYWDMKEKLADTEFFRRFRIYRSNTENKNFMRDIERRIWDMRKKNKHIYMSGGFFDCPRCSYRDLCIEHTKGGDVEFLIRNNFQPRYSPLTEEEEEDNAGQN